MNEEIWNHELRPLYLSIDVTSYCNLKCTMCFREGVKDLVYQHIPYDTFMKALNGVNPKKGVVFIGLGEPLLNPRFLDMLIEVKKRGLGTNFATSGMFVDETWANALVKMRANKISISLDGATKETYEEIRVNSNFEKVIANVKNLVKTRKELGSPFPYIRFDMVAMKKNIYELPGLIELAKEIGVDQVNLLNLQPLTRELDEQHLHNMPIEEVEAIYKEAIDLSKKLRMNLELRSLVPKLAQCFAAWTTPYVDLHGNVNACCLTGSEKNLYKEYYLGTEVEVDPKKLEFGNILKQEFRDIWLSKEYEEFRSFLYNVQKEDAEKTWDKEKYIQLRKENPKPCKYCKVCARRFDAVC